MHHFCARQPDIHPQATIETLQSWMEEAQLVMAVTNKGARDCEGKGRGSCRPGKLESDSDSAA